MDMLYPTASCPEGWFGSNCQFLCHCNSGVECDFTGECLGKCATGWFGMKCQYQDLTNIPFVTITTSPTKLNTDWLTDNDEGTCNGELALESLQVIFPNASDSGTPDGTSTWNLADLDTSCDTDNNTHYREKVRSAAYPFSWLRFTLSQSEMKWNLSFTFTSSNGEIINCSNETTFAVDDTTVDYRCDLHETIQEITV
ncbi:hypothetical protein Btru_049376 [Bulinus truncatus]|nr:hypothetical protein Btru_049376 [Bulinus truncatus]